MSESFNPYAPPKTSCKPLAVPHETNCWRDGKLLVLQNGSHLPPRCVKCNAPVSRPGRMRLIAWHHPALYLLVLLYILPYVIAAALTQKAAQINPSLCPTHNAGRTAVRLICFLSFLAGGWFIGPIGFSGDTYALGLSLLMFAFVMGQIARSLAPVEITRDLIKLRGCGPAFLDSLPPAPEPR